MEGLLIRPPPLAGAVPGVLPRMRRYIMQDLVSLTEQELGSLIPLLNQASASSFYVSGVHVPYAHRNTVALHVSQVPLQVQQHMTPLSSRSQTYCFQPYS